jgi:hypothetical protein
MGAAVLPREFAIQRLHYLILGNYSLLSTELLTPRRRYHETGAMGSKRVFTDIEFDGSGFSRETGLARG